MKQTRFEWTIPTLTTLALGCITVVACNSGSSSTPPASPSSSSSSTGSASVMVSDPATCSGPSGPFAHVFVTITGVQANVSSNAGDNDSGWINLTPNLSSQPKQIDLLGQANNQCFLATLGDTQQLQAGSYRQIRLILADNSSAVTNNACGT